MNEKIKTLYENMYSAMIHKDKSALEKLHSDDFVLVHMTGMRQNKEEYINAILNGTLNYYSALHEDISVDVNGSTALLVGKSKVDAAGFGGGRYTWRLKLTIDILNINGEWLLNKAVASTY